MDTIQNMQNLSSWIPGHEKNPYIESVLRRYKNEAEHSLNGPVYSNNSRCNENGITGKLSVKPSSRDVSYDKIESLNEEKRSQSGERWSVRRTSECTTNYYNNLAAKSSASFQDSSIEYKFTQPLHLPCTASTYNYDKFQQNDSIQLDKKYSDSSLAKTEASDSDAGPKVAPVLLTADQTVTELSDTKVEGLTICGFLVGGEMRLCLPQVINIILDRFSVDEIRPAYDELHVFCALCTNAQLDVLKRAGVLPVGAPSCGLISKTDAERLCAKLLHHSKRRHNASLKPATKSREDIRVYHGCFGKCFGVLHTLEYTSEDASSISCFECGDRFTPAQFVCHSHSTQESRTVHWGFDSARWRRYILIDKKFYTRIRDSQGKKELTLEQAKELLDNVKNGSFGSNSSSQRKRHLDSDWKQEEVSYVKRCRSSWSEVGVDRETSGLEGDCVTGITEGSSSTVSDEDRFLKPTVRNRRIDTTRRNVGFEPNISLSSRDTFKNLDQDKVCHKKSYPTEAVIEQKRSRQSGALGDKLSDILGAELCMFKSLLGHSDVKTDDVMGSDSMREFISLQHSDHQLMNDLLQTYRKQQQELKYMYRLTRGSEIEVRRETVQRDRQAVELKVEQDKKLREAELEISRLKQEIEAMINGNKRSDVGLMKAKYKAQAEHFRRKLLSAEQVNEDLSKQLADARCRLSLVTRGGGGEQSITSSAARLSFSLDSTQAAGDVRDFHEQADARRRVNTYCLS